MKSLRLFKKKQPEKKAEAPIDEDWTGVPRLPKKESTLGALKGKLSLRPSWSTKQRPSIPHLGTGRVVALILTIIWFGVMMQTALTMPLVLIILLPTIIIQIDYIRVKGNEQKNMEKRLKDE